MQDSPTSSFNNPTIASDLKSLLFALDSIGIGLWEYDVKTNMVVWDDHCKKLYGLARGSKIDYEDAVKYIHPDDVERVKTAVAAAVAGENGGHYEERYRTIGADDGKLRWVHYKGQLYYDEDRRPTRMVGTAQEITSYIAAQGIAPGKIEESAKNLHNMILQAPVAMTIMRGPDFVVEVVNSQMLNHWGKTAEEALQKPIFEVLPHAKGKGFEEMLQKVYKTGEPVSGYGVPVPLIRNGQLETIYVTFGYEAYREPDGAISGVMAVVSEVTEQIVASQRIEESEHLFRSLIEEAPVATALYMGRQLKVQLANEAMLSIWGKGSKVTGQLLVDALPELDGQPFLKILDEVFTTGVGYEAKGTPAYLVVDGVLGIYYFDFTYKPLFDTAGEVYAIINMAVDVTAQLLAHQEIEASRLRLLNSFEQSPVAIAVIDKDNLTFQMANSFYGDLVGRKPEQIISKPLLEALPELKGQGFDQLLEGVIATGNPFTAQEVSVDIVRKGEMETIYVDLTYQPQWDSDNQISGVLVVATDMTVQVNARKKVEESELFVRSILENSPVAKVVFTGENMVMDIVNETMLEMLGRDSSIIGLPFMTAVPELVNTPMMGRLRHVFTTGETYYQPEEKINLLRYGKPYTGYYNYTYKALHNVKGEIYGIIATAIEVTEQVTARQKLEEAEVALRGAIELAELGNWSLDLTTRLLYYSDRLKFWFGLEGIEGPLTVEQAYTPIVENDRPLVSTSMNHAITPGSDGVYDVEYTAINQKTGRERIIHAQGKALYNDQGIPYKVNGTAQDVTEQRKTQLALEQQVQERTEELATINEELITTNEDVANANERLLRSNEELAQYAYVASHDLQEPLRKIQVFSGLLHRQKDLSEENAKLVSKISQSSERMTMLIQDLLEFSRLLNSEALIKSVDLNEVCQRVANDFELSITEKGAIVYLDQLPVIEAVSLQMNQLFHNLFSNALKFSKPDTAPMITIKSELIDLKTVRQYIFNPDRQCNYYHITFADNGIGFEEQYAEHIFEVFKRLHGKDAYPGSGIGLALCRRIVTNQRGHLYATSKPGEGTTFHIILPDRHIEIK